MNVWATKQRVQDTITAISKTPDDDLRVMVLDFAAILNRECGSMTSDELRRTVQCYWKVAATMRRTVDGSSLYRLGQLLDRIELIEMDRQNKHERNWGDLGRFIK